MIIGSLETAIFWVQVMRLEPDLLGASLMTCALLNAVFRLLCILNSHMYFNFAQSDFEF